MNKIHFSFKKIYHLLFILILSFASIQCLAFPDYDDCSESTVFFRPMFRGYPLDWCANWAKDCGYEAAAAFCRLKGYDDAVSFRKRSNAGITRIINTGQICTAEVCDTFAWIKCSNDD